VTLPGDNGLDAKVDAGTEAAVETNFGLAGHSAFFDCRIVHKAEVNGLLKLEDVLPAKQYDRYVRLNGLDRFIIGCPIKSSSEKLDHVEPVLGSRLRDKDLFSHVKGS